MSAKKRGRGIQFSMYETSAEALMTKVCVRTLAEPMELSLRVHESPV